MKSHSHTPPHQIHSLLQHTIIHKSHSSITPARAMYLVEVLGALELQFRETFSSRTQYVTHIPHVQPK